MQFIYFCSVDIIMRSSKRNDECKKFIRTEMRGEQWRKKGLMGGEKKPKAPNFIRKIMGW